MSQSNYILNLLDIKDKNIILNENSLFYEKFDNIVYKVSKVLFHMNHHSALVVDAFSIKNKLMKKMVLNHLIYYYLMYVVMDVFYD